MNRNFQDRRDFLKQVGSMGSVAMMAGLPQGAMAFGGRVVEDTVVPAQAEETPQYHIKFAVCGMSHDHIYGMVGAIQRGGGELVAAWGGEEDKAAAFARRFPNVKMVKTQDEIVNDPSIQLVLSSQIANERAPLGVRVMKHGKDYLSDKPGVTSLEQLAEVRKTIAETKRIYGILYSERLEVKAAVYAGELVHQGAIGKVIQTINIAPHQIIQGHGDAGGGSGRPDWFWNPDQYGGILCDIGSHQVDQFLFYTGTRKAEVVESQIANVCAIRSIRVFRISATWCCAEIAAWAMCGSTGSRPDGLGTLGRWAAVHPGDRWLHGNPQIYRCRGEAPGKQSLHRRWQAGQIHRLQPDAAAVRSTVCRRRCESHAHSAGPGRMPAGGRTGDQRAAECARSQPWRTEAP